MKLTYLLSALGATTSYALPVDELLISTSSGPVQGYPATIEKNVAAYLGIPFAQPPVGSLRFQPPEKYVGETLIDGRIIGFACPSVTTFSTRGYDINNFNISFANLTAQGIATLSGYDPKARFDEDCLNLNVWVPTGGEAKKAVMVYIYGGSYTNGNTQIPFYDGQHLAGHQDVIVVTLNYRVDILGFHGDPASVNHNPGFLDQRMAVEWVRENVAKFGGDLARITLFGQSAGAASVDSYSYAWIKDPIVSSFILESGAAGFGKALPANNAANWYAVSKNLGCGDAKTPSADMLACMQKKPIADLLKAKGAIVFKPTVDGITGFSNYPVLAKYGVFTQVPVLVGNNDFETGLYIPASALSNYTAPMSVWEAQANNTFACPAGARANMSASHDLPVWRYRWFGNFPNTRLMTDPDSGAYHCSEVPFIFDTLPTGPGIPEDTPEEISIRAYVQGAWAAFAKDPVNGLSNYEGGWPKYTPYSPSVIRLGYNNVTGPNVGPSGLYDSTCATTFQIAAPAAAYKIDL